MHRVLARADAGTKALFVMIVLLALYTAASGPRAATPNVIEAERIVLTDPKGVFRMELGAMSDSWGIRLIDTRHKLINGEPMPRLTLSISENDAAGMVLRGGPMDDKVRGYLDLGVSYRGWAHVRIADPGTGYLRAVLGETRIMWNGEPEKRDAGSLVISDPSGKPIWKVP